jgi:F-type H+-transporting ATPase subunit a
MPEHTTWLHFVPGHDVLDHWIRAKGHGWLFSSESNGAHVASILFVSLVIALFGIVGRRGLARTGDDILPETRLSVRTVLELLVEGILKIMTFAMPHEAAIRHFWIVGPLGFFILFSNLLGLVPGFLPPTENFNTTFACGTIVFVYYNAFAFFRLGLGHLGHMANPVGEWWGWFLAPLFLPIELISHFIRPISLAFRLLCNIAGDHLVLSVFVSIFPLFLPIPALVIGLFVALIQTFIFVLLSCVYIGEVEANIAHHEAAHADHHGAGSPATAH